MHITLTKKQYLALAKAVYLGNWMATAHLAPQERSPTLEEYSKIMDYVFSHATQFGFTKDLEHELECGKNHDMDTEVNKIHEAYDEDSFWEEISDRLGERDFYRTYSPTELQTMSREKRFEKIMECTEVWENEFEIHGIERITVMKTVGDLIV